MDAHRAGGSFAAYKRAFAARGVVPTGPRARVPSSLELIALNRQRKLGDGQSYSPSADSKPGVASEIGGSQSSSS